MDRASQGPTGMPWWEAQSEQSPSPQACASAWRVPRGPGGWGPLCLLSCAPPCWWVKVARLPRLPAGGTCRFQPREPGWLGRWGRCASWSGLLPMGPSQGPAQGAGQACRCDWWVVRGHRGLLEQRAQGRPLDSISGCIWVWCDTPRSGLHPGPCSCPPHTRWLRSPSWGPLAPPSACRQRGAGPPALSCLSPAPPVCLALG